MQIKLGEYVQHKISKDVYRADYIREDGLICFRNHHLIEIGFREEEVSQVEGRITPFKINSNGQVYEKRYIKALGKTYQFIGTMDRTGVIYATWGEYRKDSISMAYDSTRFPTMGLACAWLELQYIKTRVSA